MGVSRRVAVNTDERTIKGSGGNGLDIRYTIGSCHADGNIATGSNRSNWNLDSARCADQNGAVKHAVLADSHV